MYPYFAYIKYTKNGNSINSKLQNVVIWQCGEETKP